MVAAADTPSVLRAACLFFSKNVSVPLSLSLFTLLHPPHYPQKPRASQSSAATSVWTPRGEADLSCCLNHKYLSSVEALRPFTCHQLPTAPIRLHLHRLNYYNSSGKLKRLFFFSQMLSEFYRFWESENVVCYIYWIANFVIKTCWNTNNQPFSLFDSF